MTSKASMTTPAHKTGRTGHTPPHWFAEATGVQPGAFSVIGDGGQLVALVYGATREEQAANARLIAAAPDLLKALEEAVELQATNYGDATALHLAMIVWTNKARTALSASRSTGDQS